jgi:predicted outer membrane repeat protein
LLATVSAFGALARTHAETVPVCTPGAALLRVPLDCDIQTAIDSVADGGTINISAGTYLSPIAAEPTGGFGFRINNEEKAFTLQGIGSVVLDGGGIRDILQIQYFARSNGRLVTFKNLIFRNGVSSSDGVAGGVTIINGDALFLNCRFENNAGNQPSTGGGAMIIGNSDVNVSDSTFSGNTAKNEGGAISAKSNSVLKIADSTFTANRVDVPNHRISAAGGAIHIGDSYLAVEESTFEGNRAGYVGGAIFVIGTWTDDVNTPTGIVQIWNSTFRNNIAQRDASVSWVVPTEGGAVHAEDQARMSIAYSNFEGNLAGVGGAANAYRSKIIIDASYFQDNKATDTGSGTGFGGAIAATSNDTTDATNASNRPPASLTVRDSLFTATDNVAQMAGAIYAAGDSNREYGYNGVTQQSSLSENRAIVRIYGTTFNNLLVTQVASAVGSGTGGAMLVDLVDLRVENSAFMSNFADGIGTSTSAGSANNASGGALAIIRNSSAVITGTVFADNVADKFGGAAFLQGSNVVIQRSTFSNNDIHPDVVEGENRAYGSAIFSGPDDSLGLGPTGRVEYSLISGNKSIHIWDDDRYSNNTPEPYRGSGPDMRYTDMRYNGNTFWGSGFGDKVYRNPILVWTGNFSPTKSVAELNVLNVVRIDDYPNTEKSQVDNIAASAEPTAAKLLVFPPISIPNSSVPTCAAYTWQGNASATLNDASLPTRSGVNCMVGSARAQATSATQYELKVGTLTISDASIALTPMNYVPLMVR